jgi:hypothetical protein
MEVWGSIIAKGEITSVGTSWPGKVSLGQGTVWGKGEIMANRTKVNLCA